MPSVTTQRTRSRYPWPSLLLAATAILCATTPLDRMAASAFYDPALGDFLAHRAVWAAVAHRVGIWLVASVAILALALAAASWRWPKLRTWRREALYVVVCIALATGTVGWLKGVTNVDCPWDQSTFGGTRPDIGWLDRRPAGLPQGHCFPGGHASGGFSLLALAAVYGRRRPERARHAVAIALAVGFGYAATQWSRGAHFPSHDLVSAWISWNLCWWLEPILGRAAHPQAP